MDLAMPETLDDTTIDASHDDAPPTDARILAEVADELAPDGPSLRTLQRWAAQGRVRVWRDVVDGVARQLMSVAEVRAFMLPKSERGGATRRPEPTPAEAAVTSWRDARAELMRVVDEHRERVEALRLQHEREVERLAAAHEREVTQLARVHVDARRWGRGGVALAVIAVVGAGVLVVRERDRAYAAQLDGQAAAAEVRVDAAAEVGSLRERAAAAERQAAEAQLELERQERAAKALGEGLARVLRGGS